jgi:NAD(P)-dependent dehydrogenase (short-subunit alcohol dehydrogenase family)
MRRSGTSMLSATMLARGEALITFSRDTWRWVFDVNVMGVHGISTFVPLISAHGEGGHIVNTASMAGILSPSGFGPYSASKFAVVFMSEGLATQLKPVGIGVSVLCPGYVRTRIHESGRHRPERYGPTKSSDPGSPAAALMSQIAGRVQSGLDPSEVAARVVTAIREDHLYVFTHQDENWRAKIEERFAAILTAMDKGAH